MEEGKLFSAAEAKKVRCATAQVALQALMILGDELKHLNKLRASNPAKYVLSEEWVRNFKFIADQVRRDYRVSTDVSLGESGEVSAEPVEQPPLDPFAELVLCLGPDAEVA